VKLAVAFGWHRLAWEELALAVTHAEALGFAAVFVDGDVSQLPSRGEADVLDGWTVTAALLARTHRIQVGSIRLVHHWNAARLAQAVATLERIAPGRLRFLISIGGQPADGRFGLPDLPAAERIAWLDETLRAVRALWRGETVSVQGRHVRLDGARVRPLPRGGGMPIEVAAARPRMLELVAAHADVWDVNLPPLPARVGEAAAHLTAACRRIGRDPARIRRTQWLFVRAGRDPADPSLIGEFRRLNPWFADLTPAEVAASLIAGSPEGCRARVRQLAAELSLDLPVLDLSGLPSDAVRQQLEAFSPTCVDWHTPDT
jgi:alkanesulfonate monooxygenase SsuD/methylene tetrahydromethanopterin reductase-like flavin-dependent oxidoreductase (luciferase family)